MNYRRILIVLLFTPVTGLFLFMFGTSLIPLVIAILLEIEPNDDNMRFFLLSMLLAAVLALIGAFFLNRAIYDSVSKPASKTQEGDVRISGNLIVKAMLYGAIGSVAPYILAVLAGMLIRLWDPHIADTIYESVGILGTLACLPTLFIGSILGVLFVWLVVRFERPSRIYMQIEESTISKWIFIVAFIGGFLATPLLGIFFAFVVTFTE